MGYIGSQISLRLPEALLAEIDRHARRSRRSRSDVIRDILETHLRGPDRAVDSDHPYARVRDLLGSVSAPVVDLGRRHREHLVEMVRDRRG